MAASDPTELGPDGILADIEVTEAKAANAEKPAATADVGYFFTAPYNWKVDGKVKLYRTCKQCP